MKKVEGQDTLKELMHQLLSVGTLDYFELAHIVKDRTGLILILSEKNEPPTEYTDQTLYSKDYLPEVRI